MCVPSRARRDRGAANPCGRPPQNECARATELPGPGPIRVTIHSRIHSYSHPPRDDGSPDHRAGFICSARLSIPLSAVSGSASVHRTCPPPDLKRSEVAPRGVHGGSRGVTGVWRRRARAVGNSELLPQEEPGRPPHPQPAPPGSVPAAARAPPPPIPGGSVARRRRAPGRGMAVPRPARRSGSRPRLTRIAGPQSESLESGARAKTGPGLPGRIRVPGLPRPGPRR
jgi:hypothetical protein